MENVQDLFISHAGPDKERYIAPLTDALSSKGITFWLDNHEIAWGDIVSMRINKGLETSRFVLLCLSHHFLGRRWPEAEMSAALSIQNEKGVKRILPLILNSKEEVLERYPLLAGLAYREFATGPMALAAELATFLPHAADDKEKISVVVESVHTGKLCNISTDPRVSVRWLRDRAQAGLGLSEWADTGAYVPFKVRWVLVDVYAEAAWLSLPRTEKRSLKVMLLSEKGPTLSHSDSDRLSDLGVKTGTVFHMYAIEDEESEDSVAADWASWR
jgi:hypothetical protein